MGMTEDFITLGTMKDAFYLMNLKKISSTRIGEVFKQSLGWFLIFVYSRLKQKTLFEKKRKADAESIGDQVEDEVSRAIKKMRMDEAATNASLSVPTEEDTD